MTQIETEKCWLCGNTTVTEEGCVDCDELLNEGLKQAKKDAQTDIQETFGDAWKDAAKYEPED